MKTAFVLFLIFVAFGSTKVIDRVTELEPLCQTTPSTLFTLTKSELNNYPAKAAGQSFEALTLAFFTHWQADECTVKQTDISGDKTLLEIKIGTNTLLKLVNPKTTGLQELTVYDKDDTAVSVITLPIMTKDLEERVAISIDLKNGVVSAGIMGGFITELYKTASKESINFGTLAFDDSVEIIFDNEYHTGDVLVEYSQFTAATSLYQYMFTPQAPQGVALYQLKEGSGYTVKPDSQNAADTIYFGANTATTTDASETTNPSWGTDGVEFSQGSQYLFKPVSGTKPFYGSTADYHGWILSFTASLWINLEKLTTGDQTVIRSIRESEWGSDAFVAKINKDGKVVVEVAGNVFATSNEAVPLNQWTLLTIHFGGFQNFFGYANIYFGATLQTEKFKLVKLAPPPNVQRLLALADEDRGMVYGGFIGKLRSFATMGAGAVELKPSTTSGCMVDFGFENSVCLAIAEQCPDGSTSFPCGVEKGDDHDGYHLSGGAVSGIVIGSVAFGFAIGAAIFFIVGRKMKGGKKEVNRYQMPSSPTEA